MSVANFACRDNSFGGFRNTEEPGKFLVNQKNRFRLLKI